MNGRLFRSEDDRMLAGVAGGLAELWGVDSSLVRIVWALLVVFTGGIALLVYIIMALVVPDEDELDLSAGVTTGLAAADARAARQDARAARRAARRGSGSGGTSAAIIVGAILVLLGVFFLVREYLPQFDFDFFWPLVLVGIGLVLVFTALGRKSEPAVQPTPPPPPAAVSAPPATTPSEPPPPGESV